MSTLEERRRRAYLDALERERGFCESRGLPDRVDATQAEIDRVRRELSQPPTPGAEAGEGRLATGGETRAADAPARTRRGAKV